MQRALLQQPPHDCRFPFFFLVRRCRRTWKVRPSTWTVPVSAWSSPVRRLVVLVHNGCERTITSSMISFSFLHRTDAADARGRCALQPGVHVSAWSSPVRCNFERPMQLSHFSDSLGGDFWFCRDFSLVEHEHANQTEIGIFQLFKGQALLIAFSFLCPTDVADARGRPLLASCSGLSRASGVVVIFSARARQCLLRRSSCVLGR